MKQINESTPMMNYQFCEMSGEKADTLILETELEIPVEAEALKRGLKAAMQNFPHFSSKPFIKGDKLYTVVDDQLLLPVFSERNEGRCFGTDETFGYLFYISYQQNKFRLHAFSGLCDAEGAYIFLNTLLYNYFNEESNETAPAGYSVIDPYQRALDTLGGEVPSPDSFWDGISGWLGVEHPFTLISEPKAEYENGFRVYSLDVPADSLARIAEEAESSLCILLDVLAADTLRKVCEVNEQMVSANTLFSLRREFDINCCANASYSLCLPYDPQMDRLSLPRKAAVMERTLRIMTTRENLRNVLSSRVKQCRKLFSEDDSIKKRCVAIAGNRRDELKSTSTFQMSYLKQSVFTGISSYPIKAIRAITVPCAIPLCVNAIEDEKGVHISWSSSVDDDRLFQHFFTQMSELIPKTTQTDLGRFIGDSLLPERL